MSCRIRIVFLGTSATFPTKSRNHPGIFLEFLSEGILFDCGEGIQRQMIIKGISPTKISKILITHLHGDHILGLPGIFQNLINSNYRKILSIYGPKGIKDSLKHILLGFKIKPNFKYEVHELEYTDDVKKLIEAKDYEIMYTFGKHSIPVIAYSFKEKDQVKIDKEKLKMLGIEKHPLLGKLKKGEKVKIKGVELDPKDFLYKKKGFKVTYITDTLYKKGLVDLAKDSDILIVEGMYSLKDKELSKEHMHLSIEDSVRIAEESGSRVIVIVHISQRYEKNLHEVLSGVYTDIPIVVAKDFMEICYVKNKLIIDNLDEKIVFYRDEKTGKIMKVS